ncbi:uncharacterized protein BKA55DRAFT_698025 [Fusarium redolens]|uniref:Uncharacterized protein n=1 Tax=Fusarium redolens TaxID=48865 RepID=A0A9P9JKR9_FUSRE|nr:uncharacterized protein BKA55DRAFT_698025 [Fusarium redolens]KAH7210896.1 hypothetical protein BKA55DRAFT_698025 [Fusarium redolens]
MSSHPGSPQSGQGFTVPQLDSSSLKDKPVEDTSRGVSKYTTPERQKGHAREMSENAPEHQIPKQITPMPEATQHQVCAAQEQAAGPVSVNTNPSKEGKDKTKAVSQLSGSAGESSAESTETTGDAQTRPSHLGLYFHRTCLCQDGTSPDWRVREQVASLQDTRLTTCS